MNKYDPDNYTKYPAVIVNGSATYSTKLKSSLLLIKWQILTPNRDRKLKDSGEVLVSISTPLGNLPETKHTLIQSMDSNLIQFLNVPLSDNLPYELSFTNGQNVSKSQLTIWEFIPYITSGQLYQIFNNYMPSNNPASIDQAAMTAAMIAAVPTMAQQIGAATQTATAAALAAEKALETAKNSIDRDVKIVGWTGNQADHLVIQTSTNRIETKIFNRHNQRMYISIGTPFTPGAPLVAKTFESYTEILEPNGSYISTDDDRLLPIYLYLAAGKPAGQASITELMP